MSVPTHRFQIGDFECIAILDRQRSGLSEGFFPIATDQEVAEAARALGYDPAAVPLHYIPLAINTGDQWVLVDTGNPQYQDGEFEPGQFLEGLRAAGVIPEEIAVIIISHCHPDHIGGMTDENGNFIYPNARYVFCKAEWDYWLGEGGQVVWGQEYGDYLQESLLPNQHKTILLEEETEIVPGISAVFLPGHTPGHMGLRIESAGEQLLHIVDAAHSLIQMAHPDWSPKFDTDPVLGAETRRKVFAQAAQEEVLVMDFHFPFPGLGHIITEGDAFQWQPLEA